MMLFDQINELWERSSDLGDWIGRDTAGLIYGKGQEMQLERLRAIEEWFRAEYGEGPYIRVAGSHFSKSVELPVALFRFHWCGRTIYVFFRDNYYNWMVVVVSSHPLHLKAHPEKSFLSEESPSYFEGINRLVPEEAFQRYVEGCRVFSADLGANFKKPENFFRMLANYLMASAPAAN